jgi:NAD(P)-dependent dehydrogenase (short-subunit alcohol dehydrogenase family)
MCHRCSKIISLKNRRSCRLKIERHKSEDLSVARKYWSDLHTNYNMIFRRQSFRLVFIMTIVFDRCFLFMFSLQRAIPDHTSYCASKGAVNQVTRVMSIELGPHGIRTNNVNPTVVMTKMGAKAWSDPAKSNPILNRIPLGRFAGKRFASVLHLYNFNPRSSWSEFVFMLFWIPSYPWQ